MVYSFGVQGFEGAIIQVETDLRRGIPGIEIVGLASDSVRESRERIRIAFRSCGIAFPQERILINLSPGDVRKTGVGFDLPIALSLLQATGKCPVPLQPLLALGELQLSGEVRPVKGVFAAVARGMEEGINLFVVPQGNLKEAQAVPGAQVYAVGHLSQALSLEPGVTPLAKIAEESPSSADKNTRGLPLEILRGAPELHLALQVAAAGGHHLLLAGPPGGGKTLSSRVMEGLLPPLDFTEALRVTHIWSLAGKVDPRDGLVQRRPLRSPHHSSSAEGLLGGGRGLLPGEVSLAHGGVLFLDEAPEFSPHVLQSLREPLEEGAISLARAGMTTRYPAAFQLMLAANRCPCGALGAQGGFCCCSPQEVQGYWKRMGGALLDRVDLRIMVTPPTSEELLGPPQVKSREVIERVSQAALRQRERQGKSNCRLGPQELENIHLTTPVRQELNHGSRNRGLSARGFHSALRVALTLMDLEGTQSLAPHHVTQALELRREIEDFQG